MRSSVAVGFTRVRPVCLLVHPGSLRSLRCALVIVGIIHGRLVHYGAPWRSLGSSGYVSLTRERPGGRLAHACRWVHPRSLGTLGCALRVVGFIWGRVLMGARLGSMGSSGIVVFTRVIREGRCVHSGAPWGSLGLCVVDVFNRVCPGVRWVHPGSLGSHRCT